VAIRVGNVIALSEAPFKIAVSDLVQESLRRLPARQRVDILGFIDEVKNQPSRILKARLDGHYRFPTGLVLAITRFKGYVALVSVFHNLLTVLRIWTRLQYENVEPLVRLIKKLFARPESRAKREFRIATTPMPAYTEYELAVAYVVGKKVKVRKFGRFILKNAEGESPVFG